MLQNIRQAQTGIAERREEAHQNNRKAAEAGFTLIELLIVIVILGILAAVVVFSVRGITDKGQDAACQADFTTVQNAEEAAYAQDGAYLPLTAAASADSLVSKGYLSQASKYFNATTSDGTGYKIAGVLYNGQTCSQTVTVNGG